MIEFPYPKVTFFGENSTRVRIPEVVQKYRDNGYSRDAIADVAHSNYKLRQEMGVPATAIDDWGDAELACALECLGIQVSAVEIVMRRKILLPCERDNKHFRLGDTVVFYRDPNPPYFESANVTWVTKESFPRVEFITKRPAIREDSTADRRWLADIRSPGLLHEGEFHMLTMNRFQRQLWLEHAGDSEDPEYREFVNSLNSISVH